MFARLLTGCFLLVTFFGGFNQLQAQIFTRARTANAAIPDVSIAQVYPIHLPGADLPEAGITDEVDSNSPLHWDDQGNLYFFPSVRHPFRSSGKSLYTLSPSAQSTTIEDTLGVEGGKWLEATWRTDDGTLYGWYHNEPPGVCSNDPHLSAPRIGAMVSHDEGATWKNLGIILEAPADALDCNTKNYYFAGGNGDFSVMLDASKNYFYFFFGTYHRQVEEQGVSIARMSYADRDQPIGKLWKWRDGVWNEPGLGGHVTPVFPIINDWHAANPDAYWGPSIHFNTYLNSYVIVLNHAIDKYWGQEGVYISYNNNLFNPQGWLSPDRLPLDVQGMSYPQIVGIEKGGTDKLAGQTARLFLLGQSIWQITFRMDGNDGGECDDCLGQTPGRPALAPREAPPVRQPVRAARPSILNDLAKPPRKKTNGQRSDQ